jgi:hypothetical protein
MFQNNLSAQDKESKVLNVQDRRTVYLLYTVYRTVVCTQYMYRYM